MLVLHGVFIFEKADSARIERASERAASVLFLTNIIFPSTPWTNIKIKQTNQMPFDLVESKSNLKFEYQSISLDPNTEFKNIEATMNHEQQGNEDT